MKINQWRGYDEMGVDRNTAMALGYIEHEVLDASSGNADASTILNCRGIKVDTAGIVKIDYTKQNGNTDTEVLYLNGGLIHQVRNVIRLYRYYTGTTDGTAACYGDDGVAITNAIKLLR